MTLNQNSNFCCSKLNFVLSAFYCCYFATVRLFFLRLLPKLLVLLYSQSCLFWYYFLHSCDCYRHCRCCSYHCYSCPLFLLLKYPERQVKFSFLDLLNCISLLTASLKEKRHFFLAFEQQTFHINSLLHVLIVFLSTIFCMKNLF